ncbi:MAG: hypothetical protein KF912_05420 [Phycisphaeraceae bacterium]|nr:hypothetical protein [Phycisphaeraceae bacterium]MBX3366737.1 hypothetical protein [Phycisphaeraceae bacterium]QYK46896.1 MAG: hypothetical protein KF838_08870 [Phycisphaeraceae bacterium]
MARDPIIDEVRKVRQDLLARFGHDLNAYVKHLNQKHGASKRASKPGATKPKASKRPGKGRAA